MGRKLGAVPLCGRGAGSLSNTMWPGPRPTCVMHARFHLDPSNRLATVHERHRQDRQRSDSIGRSVLQTVAQKRLNVYEILYCHCPWLNREVIIVYYATKAANIHSYTYKHTVKNKIKFKKNIKILNIQNTLMHCKVGPTSYQKLVQLITGIIQSK